MGILDRAKAHYTSQPASHIDVPEWGEGDTPLRVHFTPLTIGQRRRIFARDEHGQEPHSTLVCVRALIEKATDADGTKLFGEMDEHALTYKVDSLVVGRIASAILYGLPKSGAEAEESIDDAKNG